MATTPASPAALPSVLTPAASPTFHASERWRKPVSFLFAAAWLGVALIIRPNGFQDMSHSFMEMTGFLMLIIAALGRVWAFAYIGGRKNQELCRGGPYSLTRNPLYLFSFLGVCGAGLALQSPALFATACAFFLGYYALVIRAEESRLALIFGSAFARYRAEVPRFWPRWRKPESALELTISSRLLNRCLLEVFWFLAAIVVIEVIEMAKSDQWWHVWSTRF
jgi:protein-S-isoprenylcysteine O-methyltransferase Ste14